MYNLGEVSGFSYSGKQSHATSKVVNIASMQEESYDAKYARYCERCVAANVRPKPKADAYDLPTTKTPMQLWRLLTKLEAKGKLRVSPPAALTVHGDV